MNTTPNFPKTETSAAKPVRRFNSKLALGLASACLGAALLLPVAKYGLGYHQHRLPAGQFQADMRTMVAGVRYLLAPEADFQPNTTPISDRPVTLEQSDKAKI